MSISVNIIQRKDKINRNNTAPIHIRFTQKSKSRYISTGITLPLGAWDDSEQHIVSTYPDSDAMQMQITAKRLEIEKKIQRLEALDADVNFDTLLGQKSRYINCTVSDYFKQQIDYLKSIGKVGSASKYETCKSLLEQCNLGKKRFEQVDLQFLQDFEAYMTRKGNSSNSLATSFSVLRAVYNKAVKQKVFTETDNGVKDFIRTSNGRTFQNRELTFPHGSIVYSQEIKDVLCKCFHIRNGLSNSVLGIFKIMLAFPFNKTLYYMD